MRVCVLLKFLFLCTSQLMISQQVASGTRLYQFLQFPIYSIDATRRQEKSCYRNQETDKNLLKGTQCVFYKKKTALGLSRIPSSNSDAAQVCEVWSRDPTQHCPRSYLMVPPLPPDDPSQLLAGTGQRMREFM